MISIEDARAIASKDLRSDMALSEPGDHREGWFFTYVAVHSGVKVGFGGVIVNKHTGKLKAIDSAYPARRQLELYDLGYQFERYDLVIVAIRDFDATSKALGELSLQLVETTYENGEVWRIPRLMTSAEIARPLMQLPCIFPSQSLRLHALEVLESARATRWFEFEALECRVRLA